MPIDLVIDEREGGSTTSKSSSENPPDPTEGVDQQVRQKYFQKYRILNYIYWFRVETPSYRARSIVGLEIGPWTL